MSREKNFPYPRSHKLVEQRGLKYSSLFFDVQDRNLHSGEKHLDLVTFHFFNIKDTFYETQERKGYIYS